MRARPRWERPRAVSVLSALSAGVMPDISLLAGHEPTAVPIWALDPKHSERSGYGFRDYETTAIAYRDTFGARLRRHYITACPRWTSSPILQNLVFGTHPIDSSIDTHQVHSVRRSSVRQERCAHTTKNRTEVLCPRVTQAAMIAAASFGLRRSGRFATATSGAAYGPHQ
jgi:hypothetical protein